MPAEFESGPSSLTRPILQHNLSNRSNRIPPSTAKGLRAAHNTNAPAKSKQHEQKEIHRTNTTSLQSIGRSAHIVRSEVQYPSYMPTHASRIRVGTIDSNTPDLATQSVQSVQSNPSVHRKGLRAAHNTSTPAKCESVPSIRISLLKSESPSKPHRSHPSQMNEQFSALLAMLSVVRNLAFLRSKIPRFYLDEISNAISVAQA